MATSSGTWKMSWRSEVYTRPYDPHHPLVCLDETSKQLLRETRAGQPPAPGRPARRDYEYEREGVVNLFLCCEPLAGQRWVDVTAQRTRRDWAQQIQQPAAGGPTLSRG